MSKLINFEDYKKDNSIDIEFSDETITLEIPARTKTLYEQIVEVEKERKNISEYEYYKRMIESLSNKETFKKLDEKSNGNLDFLGNVTITAIEIFVAEKIEAEKKEFVKKMQMMEPLTDKLNISKTTDKVK